MNKIKLADVGISELFPADLRRGLARPRHDVGAITNPNAAGQA